MPANATEPAPRSSPVLATDLDGTFAGGTAADRLRLQRLIAAQRDAALLYVTGRCVSAARDLMRTLDLPAPHLLIADVGTTVVRGADFAPVAELEAALGAAWPGGDAVRARIGATWREQEVRVPRRVSYWIDDGDPHRAARHARALLDGLAVDVVGSDGRYLDVLPRGVNKGTTLRRALAWMGRPETAVVVAGDTLNDLALFETGLRGVVVGNGEAALRERVRGLANTYLATGAGAAGVLEGLLHFGWLEETNAQ